MATITAELRDWRKLATETAENLKDAKGSIVLQLDIWEAAQKDTEAPTMELSEYQEQLAAANAKTSQLLARLCKLNDELIRVKLQNATGTTMSDNLKSITRACESPAKM